MSDLRAKAEQIAIRYGRLPGAFSNPKSLAVEAQQHTAAILSYGEEVRRETLEEAAKAVEPYEAQVLTFWDRPGGLPGNGYQPFTGKLAAAAIRALAQPKKES